MLTESFVANSAAMRDVVRQIELFAKMTLPVPVMITGEVGTGKARIAEIIHAMSNRANQPFVQVNCAALSETELVGCGEEPGLIEQAHGGTLFLNGIEDLTGALQARVLRFMIDGRTARCNGEKLVSTDARIIVSTTANLLDAVYSGAFLDSLYYRLHVLTLRVPPLRERTDDILPLAELLLPKIAHEMGCATPELESKASQSLQEYPWLGNMLELASVLRRAILESRDDRICAADLHLGDDGNQRADPGSPEERKRLIFVLEQSNGNVSGAARHMQVSRVTVYRMLARHGIKLARQATSRSALEVS